MSKLLRFVNENYFTSLLEQPRPLKLLSVSKLLRFANENYFTSLPEQPEHPKL